MHMGYQLQRLKTSTGCAAVSEERLRAEMERLMRQDGPRFARLWAYYQNPLRVCAVGTAEGGSERPYRQAQEWGLPSRITIRLEIVEPARALPMLSCDDYRVVEAYGQCYRVEKTETISKRVDAAAKGRWWERIWRSMSSGGAREGENSVLMTEIICSSRWQRYENEVLVAEGENSLGEIPLVHIQNTALPFEYGGASDVEPLIPLQDELNTRLSDRASRITMQSFKMYLGKGIDEFTQLPVGPGRMWTSDNPDADVISFGGDSDNPAESLHIADLREALDKTSGVSPIAAGAIKNRIGRLTSAAALRLTLISLLARTEKKRTTYGMGLARMIELALGWLDKAGIFATRPEERRVELSWPSPLPENEVEKLQEGEIKARLGVPKEVVLRELGY
jgi:hypothetical protein